MGRAYLRKPPNLAFGEVEKLSPKTLTKTRATITGHLWHEINHTRDTKALVYICFGLTDAEEGLTMQTIFADVLIQLRRSTAQFSAQVVQTFKSSRSPGSQPDLEELVCLEMKSFAAVFFVVDALDSCSDDADTGIREHMISFIKRLPNNCRTLVTSRSGTSTWMDRHFEGTPKINVEAKPADVKLYIDSRINKSSNFLDRVKEGNGGDMSLQEEIYSTVIDKAQGMYAKPLPQDKEA